MTKHIYYILIIALVAILCNSCAHKANEPYPPTGTDTHEFTTDTTIHGHDDPPPINRIQITDKQVMYKKTDTKLKFKK